MGLFVTVKRSSISITQMIHTAVAIPALATGGIYAFGRLPVNVKKGMRWTAIFVGC